MSNERLYFDWAASTPLDPQVATCMKRYLGSAHFFGNPSSLHWYGLEAAELVELARRQVASCVACQPNELIWVSGATEANNIAISGWGVAVDSKLKRKNSLTALCTGIEHLSVLAPFMALRDRGISPVKLPVSNKGVLTPAMLEQQLKRYQRVGLVSVMWVNNETGVIQDIRALSHICRHNNVLFHVDAAQAFGKVPIQLSEVDCDLVSFSAHKIGGPKGVGALFVRAGCGLKLRSLFGGGAQEQGLRPGTIPVHQVLGMGKAFVLAASRLAGECKRICGLANVLEKEVRALNGLIIGDGASRVAHIMNVYFPQISAERLFQSLPQVALSSGSACSSSKISPSHVLTAMRYPKEQALNSVRISLGRGTTMKQIKQLVNYLKKAVVT